MSFAHAPVTKGLIITVSVLSLTTSLFDVKPYLHLQLVPHLSRHHQYWRLLVHHFACSNSGSLLLTLILLYSVSSDVERIYGSSKFSAFLLASSVLCTILEFTALIVFHGVGANSIPSGPSALVFSIIYQWYRLLPSTYTFRIFSVNFSNKSFIYVLAYQLMALQPPGSVIAAAVGILAGALYRADFLGLKSWRISPRFRGLSSQYLLPLVGSTRAAPSTNLAWPQPQPRPRPPPETQTENTETISTRQSNDNVVEEVTPSGPGPSVLRQFAAPFTAPTESRLRAPSEGEITRVAGMFPDLSREDIFSVLQRSPDIEHAVEMLLTSG